MEAVVIEAYGGHAVLTVRDVLKPSPGKGKILVRVGAASVNPIDWKVAQGHFRLVAGNSFPMILGTDYSGTGEVVGAGVTEFLPGDEVFGMGGNGVARTFAEYAVVPAKAMARKPASAGHAAMAALTLVGVTTLAALAGKAAPGPGKRIFLHGGSGGVGSFAVQYCKSQGAEVIATCGAGNLDFVKSLGAGQVIDYAATDPLTQLANIDVIFDTVGNLDPRVYWSVMRRGGRIVSTGNGPREMRELTEKYGNRWWLLVGALDVQKYNLQGRFKHGVGYRMVFAVPTADRLRRIAELVDAGKVKPIIANTYSLRSAAEAFSESQAGHVRGKLVLVNEGSEQEVTS